jgi:hypothetical protein
MTVRAMKRRRREFCLERGRGDQIVIQAFAEFSRPGPFDRVDAGIVERLFQAFDLSGNFVVGAFISVIGDEHAPELRQRIAQFPSDSLREGSSGDKSHHA